VDLLLTVVHEPQDDMQRICAMVGLSNIPPAQLIPFTKAAVVETSSGVPRTDPAFARGLDRLRDLRKEKAPITDINRGMTFNMFRGGFHDIEGAANSGVVDKEFADLLVQVLNVHPYLPMRVLAAVLVRKQIGILDHAELVTALLSALEVDDAEFRMECATTLSFCKKEQRIVDNLVKLLSDSNPIVAKRAASSLAHLRIEDLNVQKQCADILCTNCESLSVSEKLYIAIALRELGVCTQKTLEVALSFLQESDKDLKLNAGLAVDVLRATIDPDAS